MRSSRHSPVWSRAGERRGQASTLNLTGVVYDDLGQPAQALDYYMRAFSLYKDLADLTGQADVLNDMAGVFSAPDQKPHAIECFNLALQLERAAQNRDGEARILDNMGLVYEDLGQKEQARESYEQALHLGWSTPAGTFSEDVSRLPKQNTSVLSMGFAPNPAPRTSLITPPTPVPAPP